MFLLGVSTGFFRSAVVIRKAPCLMLWLVEGDPNATHVVACGGGDPNATHDVVVTPMLHICVI